MILMLKRILVCLILTIAPAAAVYGQETRTPATEPSTGGVVEQDTSTDQSTTTQNTQSVYTFPTGKERFNRYVKSTVGPFSLVRTAVTAGIHQWTDHPDEWEQGASGYGKRFASNFGRNAIQQTVIYGMDTAIELDTGFKKSTRKGFFPRLKHSLVENVTSRKKNGDRIISVPRFAGVYSSSVIAAETWYPERYSYKDGLRRGTSTMLTGFALNLIREFIVSF